MATLFTETFTGADNTPVNGFNNWTATTNLLIESNQAASTTDGQKTASRQLSALRPGSQRIIRTTISRYFGTGLRFINYIFFGAATSSSYATNGIYISIVRSDHSTSNSKMEVYDGATKVATKNLTFQYDGSSCVFVLTIETDGRGSLTATQGASNDSVSFSARTWTNDSGTYCGVDLQHNGVDGTLRTTRSRFDNFQIDGTYYSTTTGLSSATGLSTITF